MYVGNQTINTHINDMVYYKYVIITELVYIVITHHHPRGNITLSLSTIFNINDNWMSCSVNRSKHTE